MQARDVQTVFLRLGLAAGFLSAVADRFGIWGPYGAPAVAWGDMQHFMTYVARLNPWFPSAVVPALGWMATIAEILCGVLLLIGWQTRRVALLSGWTLLAFAAGMTIGTGVKTALNASVFAASGGAFVLASARRYALSLDQGATDGSPSSEGTL